MINRWVRFFDSETMLKLVEVIFDLIKSRDELSIKYECFMCFKKLLACKIALNFPIIIKEITPMIFKLIESFN